MLRKRTDYFEYVLELNVVMIIESFRGYENGAFKLLRRTRHWGKLRGAIGGAFLHDHVRNGCFKITHSFLNFIHCIFIWPIEGIEQQLVSITDGLESRSSDRPGFTCFISGTESCPGLLTSLTVSK